MFKTIFLIIIKLLIGGLAFLVSFILGGMSAQLFGLRLPEMPQGFDMNAAGQMLPLVGLLMAAILGIFSNYSNVRFVPRWIILSGFSWTAYGLNNFLESKYFMPGMATSYVLVTNFIACLGCSAVSAWLFKPASPVFSFLDRARLLWASRSFGSWTWRLLVGWAVFPLAYFFFGRLVAPFVLLYYESQYAGLALPSQGVMLGLASVRSLLFLLTILPVLIIWRGNRLGLFLALGASLFLMVGGLNFLQAIYLPASLRAAHALEILADSFVHAAVLVYLIVPKPTNEFSP
jgi:hypothetical protein